MPARIGPCIYFLMQGEKVVYVGQTTNLIQRCLNHTKEGWKEFDGIKYIMISEEYINDTETFFILLLRPLYNGRACKKSDLMMTPSTTYSRVLEAAQRFKYMHSNPWIKRVGLLQFEPIPCG